MNWVGCIWFDWHMIGVVWGFKKEGLEGCGRKFRVCALSPIAAAHYIHHPITLFLPPHSSLYCLLFIVIISFVILVEQRRPPETCCLLKKSRLTPCLPVLRPSAVLWLAISAVKYTRCHATASPPFNTTMTVLSCAQGLLLELVQVCYTSWPSWSLSFMQIMQKSIRSASLLTPPINGLWTGCTTTVISGERIAPGLYPGETALCWL